MNNPSLTLGRYELLEKVATGGMAEVYRARLKGAVGSFKPICVKKILPHLSSNSQFLAMFIDEAKITLPLTHNNITAVFEFARDGQDYYLSMEFVDGADLYSVLDQLRRRNEFMSIPLAVAIAMEIARGLQYAHNFCDQHGEHQHIVHRDVSPQNILLSLDGNVKLTDFGVAKARSRITATTNGVIRGKLMYMSPEQASGSELDPRSDQYSLGLVLYEMLTNARPYEDDNELRIIHKTIAGDFAPIESHRPEIPPELTAILNQTLAKGAPQRFADCDALGARLQSFLNHQYPEFRPQWIGEMVRSLIPPKSSSSAPQENIPQQIWAQLQHDHIDVSSPDEKSGLIAFNTMALSTTAKAIPILGRPPTLDPSPPAPRPWLRVVPYVSVGLVLILAMLVYALNRRPASVSAPARLASERHSSSGKPVVPARTTAPSTAGSAARVQAPIPTPAVASDPDPIHTVKPASVTPGPAADTIKTRIPAKPAMGKVRINSEPWAYVSINGTKLPGHTPFLEPISLEAGTHTFTFFNDQLKLRKTVTKKIPPHQVVELKVTLE